MKIRSLIFVLVLLVIATTMSNSSEIIHQRIGDKIDKSEREYFFLFPYINNFESATLSKIDQMTFQFNIVVSDESNRKDTTIAIGLFALRELQKYIMNFEFYFSDSQRTDSLHKDISWQHLLSTFVMPRNIIKDIPIIEIKKWNEECKELRFIFADSTFLVLWDGPDYFDWTQIDKLVFIPYQDIIEFSINNIYKIYGNKEIYSEVINVITNDNPFRRNDNVSIETLPPEIIREMNKVSFSDYTGTEIKYTTSEVRAINKAYSQVIFSILPGGNFYTNDFTVLIEPWYYFTKEYFENWNIFIKSKFELQYKQALTYNIGVGAKTSYTFSPLRKEDGLYYNAWNLGFYTCFDLSTNYYNSPKIIIKPGYSINSIYTSLTVFKPYTDDPYIRDLSGVNPSTIITSTAHSVFLDIELLSFLSKEFQLAFIFACNYTFPYNISCKNYIGGKYWRKYYMEVDGEVSHFSIDIGIGLSYNLWELE